MRHTIVISDVHLWEGLPGDDLWMRYRQRRFFPDEVLADMLARVCAEVGYGHLELVFNGDLFDFDIAPVVEGQLEFGDPPRSSDVAVSRLNAILDEHPVFLDAVARVLAAGHRVVFVSGNHDAQMTWEPVRAVLTERLLRAVAALGPAPGLEPERLRPNIVYRAWFHRTADGVHVEHGNQYDGYCSFKYPMEPFTPCGRYVAPTTGSLVMRYLIGRLGFFNPNADSSFMLSVPEYLGHWARYYFGTPHSLVGTWLRGTFDVAVRAFLYRDRHDPDRVARNVRAAAEETGVSERAVQAHLALSVPGRAHEVAKVLRLDRLLLIGLGAAAAVLTLANRRAAVGVALASVGAVATFNLAVQTQDLTDVYAQVARRQRQIAKIHGARAVVFGHTHEAGGEWEEGVFYGNCGSWSPRFRDVECTTPLEPGRPMVWLRSRAGGDVEGGLYRYYERGEICPERARSLPPDVPAAPDTADTMDPTPGEGERLSWVA